MPEAIEVCNSGDAATGGGGGIGAGVGTLITGGQCVLKLGNATGGGGAKMGPGTAVKPN